MAILFFEKANGYKITGKNTIKNWIKNVIIREKYVPGDINIVIVTDRELIEINRKYLNHNYYTDIITFDYCEERKINGDLFISKERIRENAMKYKIEEKVELLRVIIHGILHLTGYNDKRREEKVVIRKMEDEYLKIIRKEKVGINGKI